MKPKLLLIDSEEECILKFVSDYLRSHGFEVHRTGGIKESRVPRNNCAYSILILGVEAGCSVAEQSRLLKDQLTDLRSIPATILIRSGTNCSQKPSSDLLDRRTNIEGDLLTLDFWDFVEEITR
jgi:hypothetical protein